MEAGLGTGSGKAAGVAVVLSEIGPKAEAAISALTEVSEHDSSDPVRVAAREALEKIQTAR